MGCFRLRKAIEELYEQLDELKRTASQNDDVSALNEAVVALEQKIIETRKKIHSNLSGWEKCSCQDILNVHIAYTTLIKSVQLSLRCMVIAVLKTTKRLLVVSESLTTDLSCSLVNKKGLTSKCANTETLECPIQKDMKGVAFDENS